MVSSLLEFRQNAGAITEVLIGETRLRQRGRQQVGHGRVIRILEVAAALHFSAGSAGHEDRKRGVIVQVAVAHGAAVQNQGMIQQRSVAVLNVLHLVQQVGNQADVIGVDLGQLFEFLGIVLVMRSGVERIGHANLGERAIMKLETRVMSAWKASAISSIMSLECST